MDRAQILALKEKRANVWEQSKALLDEVSGRGDGFTAEEDQTWERLERDLADLSKQIDRAETLLSVESRDAEVVGEREERTGASADQYDAIFRKWVRDGAAGLELHERKVLQSNYQSFEGRAQQVATGGAGGYTVPEGFWNRVSETMKAYGGVIGNVNLITTTTGNDLPWMTNDDTANKGAILAEGVAIGEQDVTFGVRTLGAYLYTSKLIRVSYQLLQDSAIDVEGFLARKFAERLARIHNEHFTTGSGTGQPDGLVTGATLGKATNGATAITFNEIVDLVHSIDPAYRGSGRTKFMLNDGVLAYLRKVRDDSGGSGLGRPLWEPSVQVGEPNTLFGYPYVINQDMASTVATTNTTVLFGDFVDGYVVRQVKGMNVVRLDERYAEYLQVGWFAYDRMDGTKDDTSAYKALVQA